MAKLNQNTATMDSSRGITLKTAGKYIPHDIKVKLNSSFTIYNGIDRIQYLDTAPLGVLSGSEISSLEVGKISSLNTNEIELFKGQPTAVTSLFGDISITAIESNANLEIVTLKDASLSVGNFFEAGDKTAISIQGTKVADKNGLIRVTPEFKQEEPRLGVTITTEDLWLTTGNPNNEYIPLNYSGTISSQAVLYSNNYTGWLESAKDTVVIESKLKTYNNMSQYLAGINIGNGKKLDSFSLVGSVTDFSGVGGTINNFSANTTITNLSGTANITNLTGVINFENGPSIHYDSSAEAVVFTY